MLLKGELVLVLLVLGYNIDFPKFGNRTTQRPEFVGSETEQQIRRRSKFK